jgi:dTDP-4-dehydrorhamnose 3,5-epimerase
MKALPTPIEGLLILEPRVFGDERGFFLESYNQREFDRLTGGTWHFVQDNHSRSARGVLRGLHYQLPPHAQGKLVRVVKGKAWDVAVDIRRGSTTFGCWVGTELSADNRRQLWIPPGFAHGFLALEDDTHFLYKTTDVYAKECERSIRWDDPTLAIAWPLAAGTLPQLAAKDAAAPLLADAEVVEDRLADRIDVSGETARGALDRPRATRQPVALHA